MAHGEAAQLEKIASAVDLLLRTEACVAKETISVHFVSLTDSALNLEVVAMFNTMVGDRVAAARQALLLGTVAAIQKSGAALAHPVRRVELARSEEAQTTLEREGGRRFQFVLPSAGATDSSKRS